MKWKEYQQRLPEEGEIRKWWSYWPGANIALVTGQLSKIVAIDFDSHHGQAAFSESFGHIPKTISQTTGRDGGLHLLFRHPQNGVYSNLAKSIEDVDVRGDGGYIILAPSVHASGRKYEWLLSPLDGGIDDLMDIPDEIMPMLSGRSMSPGGIKNTSGDYWHNDILLKGMTEGINDGERHDNMMRVAGKLWCNLGSYSKVLDAISDFNEKFTNPPLPYSELKVMVENIQIHEEEKKKEKSVSNLNQAIEKAVSACANEDNLKKTIGNISKIIMYNYADGDIKYDLVFGDGKKISSIDTESLLSCRLMKQNIFKATKIPVALKQKDWDDQLAVLMQSAEVNEVGEDETLLAVIRAYIEAEATSSRVATDMKYIRTHAVLAEGLLCVHVDTISKFLTATEQAGTVSRKTIASHLISLGFTRCAKDTKAVRCRYFFIPAEKI